MSKLNEIGLRHGTDKASDLNDFLAIYEQHISSYSDKEINLLEIGVLGGGSIKTWEEYFPYGQIYGIDINPETLAFRTERTSIDIVDQSDTEDLKNYAKERKFNIIIDDGSHVWGHQIKSLRILFKHLEPKGIYIIEDLDTSFGSYYRDYCGDGTKTAASYLFELSGWVIGQRQLKNEELLDPFIAEAHVEIERITFARGCAIIEKK